MYEGSYQHYGSCRSTTNITSHTLFSHRSHILFLATRPPSWWHDPGIHALTKHDPSTTATKGGAIFHDVYKNTQTT